MIADIATIIRNAIPERKPGANKGGNNRVDPAIQYALESAGYDVDSKDSRRFLRARMPVWQRYSSGGYIVDPTAGRRIIDLVVYDPNSGIPIALVEVESDLAHMGTNGDYAVASIAHDARGQPFNGYKSVERMAAAAQFWAIAQATGKYPTPAEGVERLKAIRSDRPAEHNPTGISLFLVCHVASQKHVRLLQRRLDSLGIVQPFVGTLTS